MMTLFFCNIGWMKEYRGLAGDAIRTASKGGSWIADNKRDIEVCNFRPCKDGYVYGHVETMGRRIELTRLGGGKHASVSAVTDQIRFRSGIRLPRNLQGVERAWLGKARNPAGRFLGDTKYQSY